MFLTFFEQKYLFQKYYLPTDAVGCDCPRPEKIDCDVEVTAAEPNPKVGAAVVVAPNPNVGAALVVDAPKPKEGAEVPVDAEEPNPNDGAVDVVEPKPLESLILHNIIN